MIKIGIDFDNTIAFYDEVFAKVAIKMKLINSGWKGTKTQLKKKIIENKNLENWKKLQGQVYGKYMKKALVYKGFDHFFQLAQFLNAKLFIVSHKTKYGHYDKKKINLRIEALKWLKKNKYYKNVQIFFENSIDQKINTINSLNLNFFIDDLELILDNPKLKKNIKKILINQNTKRKINKKFLEFTNWFEISDYIFKNKSLNKIKFSGQYILKKKIKNIYQLSGRKNSNIYKIKLFNNKVALLKKYPSHQHDNISRIKREVVALNFLKKKKFNCVPLIYKYNFDLNILILQFIKGRTPKKINREYLDYSLQFLEKLKKINLIRAKYPFEAVEHCQNFRNLIDQINYKYKDLLKKNIPNYLKKFLKKKIWFIFQKLIKDESNETLKKYYLKKKKPKLILSPSDFGFHNSIKSFNKIYFIDFEYFGKDDPVKLVADFILHPGMNLSFIQKKYWLGKIFQIFKDDLDFKQRLKYFLPFYSIRWSLIVLNDFKNSKKDLKIKKLQFLKSKKFYYYVLNYKFDNFI